MMFEATDSFSTMLRKGTDMKKRILIALGVLVLAASIGAGGWYYYTSCRVRREANDIVYVTKISKLSEMDSGGKPICRCCGTAGNGGSGKDRKRPKGKKVQVKTGQEVKKREGQLLFSV